MPDASNSNIELAHHLGEDIAASEAVRTDAIEIAEVFLLAIVAIATAWSGYQAARWTGYQAEQYGVAGRLRVEAEGAEMTANQERMYIATTVAEWLKAEAHGQHKVAEMFERRILPEFRPAFESWKATDPINNPNAPAGPQLMTDYRSSKADNAARLNWDAANMFEQGNQARQHSDDYVRTDVTLATILLLVAISQRFKVHRIRMAVVAFAALLLCLPLYQIVRLPRA